MVSTPPAAAVSPSGENATAPTSRIFQSKVCRNRPAGSQSLTRPSAPPVRNGLPVRRERDAEDGARHGRARCAVASTRSGCPECSNWRTQAREPSVSDRAKKQGDDHPTSADLGMGRLRRMRVLPLTRRCTIRQTVAVTAEPQSTMPSGLIGDRRGRLPRMTSNERGPFDGDQAARARTDDCIAYGGDAADRRAERRRRESSSVLAAQLSRRRDGSTSQTCTKPTCAAIADRERSCRPAKMPRSAPAPPAIAAWPSAFRSPSPTAGRVPSALADASVRPSGEYASATTRPVCPVNSITIASASGSIIPSNSARRDRSGGAR